MLGEGDVVGRGEPLVDGLGERLGDELGLGTAVGEGLGLGDGTGLGDGARLGRTGVAATWV